MSVSPRQHRSQASQNLSVGGSNSGFVFSRAPVQNNLMVSVLGHFTNGPTCVNGWTMLYSQSLSDYDVSACYKYAGAGESATQAPISGQGIGSLNFYAWELQGVTGTIGTDIPNFSHHSTSNAAITNTFTPASFTTTAANQGILGVLMADKASTTPTSAAFSGGTPNAVLDSTAIGAGGAQRQAIAKCFHDYFSTNGSTVQYTMSSITPNLAFGTFGYLQIANFSADFIPPGQVKKGPPKGGPKDRNRTFVFLGNYDPVLLRAPLIPPLVRRRLITSSAINASVNLSGAAGTSAAGSLIPSIADTLAGAAGTSAATAPSPSVAESLTGAAGASSAAALTSVAGAIVSGASAIGSAAAPSSAIVVGFSGAQSTGGAGDIVHALIPGLSGVETVSSAGAASSAIGAGLGGVEITGAEGDVLSSAEFGLAGVDAIVFAGDLGPAITGELFGAFGASDFGFVIGGVDFDLEGVSIEGGSGSITSRELEPVPDRILLNLEGRLRLLSASFDRVRTLSSFGRRRSA